MLALQYFFLVVDCDIYANFEACHHRLQAFEIIIFYSFPVNTPRQVQSIERLSKSTGHTTMFNNSLQYHVTHLNSSICSAVIVLSAQEAAMSSLAVFWGSIFFKTVETFDGDFFAP